jgi:hypothetical protein
LTLVAGYCASGGALRLWDGQGLPAGRGSSVVRPPIPFAVDLGRAEQTTAGAASVRPCVKAVLTVAAPAVARSPMGGSTANGMACVLENN